ncbi:MAG: threonine synthase, partial [Pygmaiobacter sp.]
TIILVATSGDTGKAALEGYKNLPGIEIAVFYPQNGTSEIQRLQMTTQEGDNVHVYAVDGNFDDAQTGVKHVFANTALAQELALKNCHMTSANSINWGRLAPQIVYYFASYLELCRRGEICSGTPVDFCVPTGNFGDILAGYYAKQMGLPIHQLICASNQNCVLTDFGQTGTYNAARKFYKTASPSMDILVSSNLERLLFHESGDTARVAEWMRVLMGTEQSYTIDNELREKISRIFRFGCASEEECFATLASVYRTTGYLADPHTAVALHVAQQRTEPQTPCVVLSTANPYKFSAAVLTALGESATENDFNNIAQLQRTVGTAAPKRLRELQGKDVRFTELLKPTELLRVAKTL